MVVESDVVVDDCTTTTGSVSFDRLLAEIVGIKR